MNTFFKLYASVRDKLVMLRPRAGIVAVLLALLFMLLIRPWTHIDTLELSLGLTWDGGSPQLIYIGHLLSYPLYYAHQIFPSIEPISVILVLTYLLSVGVIVHSLFGQRDHRIGNWGGPTVLVLCVYLLGNNATTIFYPLISYLGIAATLLALNDRPRSSLLRCCLLLALFTLSAGIRVDACIGILPFIGLLFLSSLRVRCYQKSILLGLMGFICLIFNFISPLLSVTDYGQTGEQYSVHDINKCRISVYDYQDCSGIDKSHAYAALNITPNDLELYEDCVPLDNRHTDQHWCKALTELRKQGNGIPDITPTLIQTRLQKHGKRWGWRPFFVNNFLIMLMALAGSRKALNLALALTHLLLSLYLVVLHGRYGGAAPDSLFLLTALLLLPDLRHLNSGDLSLFRKLTAGVLILAALYGFARTNASHLVKDMRRETRREATKIVIRNECTTHPQNVYLINLGLQADILKRFSLRSDHYQLGSNVFHYAGWGVWLPAHQLALLHQTGESNLEKIMQSPNCYLIERAAKDNTQEPPEKLQRLCTMQLEHHRKNVRCVPVRKLSEDVVLYQFREVMPDGTTAAAPEPTAQPRE
ncbi:MAG: hypothetical protein ACI4O9_03845 [Akkermansia sp.]